MAKGIGSYSWTMTLFQSGREALDSFQHEVLDIWNKPSDEKIEGALRIRYQIEWTSKEKGAAVNAKVLAKDKGAQSRKIENPLKEFLK